MIRRNAELERQRLEIAINTRAGGDGSSSDERLPTLPYDPTNAPDDDTTTQILAANYLDNSDFDFSKDGYINSPPTGGDAAEEAYNWYRQRFIKVTDIVVSGAPTATVTSASGPFKAAYTYPMDFVLLNGDTGGVALSGTLTRTDDNTATLSTNAQNDIASGGVLWFGETLAESSANALKASGHSLFAANEGANGVIPRWDKTNGWAEIGSDAADRYDLACPLPINLVRGGLTFHFRCIVSQRAGTAKGDPVRLSVGVWDATAAEKRFIESSNLDLTVTPVGTTGATNYSYVILADLDDGRTIVSDTVTIANGNAALSSSNYNRLTWANATGVLNFRIYRSVGGVVKRVFTIRNGAHDFNDTGGDEGETPASLPAAGTVRPIAYVVTSEFNPNSADVWQPLRAEVEIPGTYDTSRTTGKQWIRIQVEGNCGTERMVLIDRMLWSLSNGGWQRSARDLNKILNQNPTSLPTSTTQGNTGVNNCFTLDTPVVRCNQNGDAKEEVSIGEIDRGDFILDGNRVRRVTGYRDGETTELVEVGLSNGISWRCSPSEKFITNRADRFGTRIDALTFGDTIQSWSRWRYRLPYIRSYRRIVLDQPVTVRTLSLRGGKTFLVGRLIGWRRTIELARNVVRRLLRKEPQFIKARAHNAKPVEPIIV